MERVIIAKAVLFDKEGRLLLVRRSETAPRRPLEWDLPGGFIDDADHSFQHACVREVHEETGITVSASELRLAFAASRLSDSSFSQKDVSYLYFVAVIDDTSVNLSFEHDKFTWAQLEKALDMITYEPQQKALQHIAQAGL